MKSDDNSDQKLFCDQSGERKNTIVVPCDNDQAAVRILMRDNEGERITMGLFGDDFYSTKVSRRAEPVQKGKLQILRPGGRDRWQNPRKSRSGISSTVK